MDMGGREMVLTVPVVERSWDRLRAGDLVVVGVNSVKVVTGVTHSPDRVHVEGQDGNLDTFPAEFFDKRGFWTVINEFGWWVN